MPKKLQKNKLFSFYITDENKKILIEFSKKNKINMAQALNFLIANIINDSVKIHNFCDNSDEKTKNITIKIFVNNEEYETLKKAANKEFLSIRKYIKFILSKYIYDGKSLSMLDLKLYKDIKNELQYLGKNINTLAKNSHIKEKLDRSFELQLKFALDYFANKKDFLEEKILLFTEINENRF